MTARLNKLDRRLLLVVRLRFHRPLLDRQMQRLGAAGEHGMLWVGLGVVAALIDRGRGWKWLAVGLAAPLAIIPNGLLKRVIRRPRPDLGADLPPLAKARRHSFPSSHAAASFASVAAAYRVERRSLFGALPLAVLVSIGRPYLGVHYPGDILAGASLGLVVGTSLPIGDASR